MHEKDKPLQEIVQAALLWPIWLRIGFQDIRRKYRRSALGVGWIFLHLALSLFTIGLVYSYLLGQHLREFLPFLTIGLMGWGYLTSSILEGGNAFVASEGYIKQIGLPIYIYVFRFFVSITATLLISLPAYFLVAFIYSIRFRPGALWALLGFFLLTVVCFLMIAIFSHLNARFRDVAHIASVGLQILFYVTPVIWPPKMIDRTGLRWVVDFNPFYHLLEVVRQPLLISKPATALNYLVVLLLISGLTGIAWAFTKRYNKRIAYYL